MLGAINAKIIEDAKVIAASTLEEGQAKATEILTEIENQVAISKEKFQKEMEQLKADIIRRQEGAAGLEVKKIILAAKMQMLDKVFEEGLAKLLNLPKKEYLQIISGMLKYSEDGDTVCISEKDRDIITKAFIEKQAQKRGINLTLATNFADIEGGIILSSGDMDKNLSIRVGLKALRDELESEIAKKLFGEKK